MLYMLVEHFKNHDAVPVYRRFRDHGRLAPDGLNYVSSWVDSSMRQCFQLMETDNRQLLDDWIASWSDLIDFEVFAVMSSQEAYDRIAPQLNVTHHEGAGIPSESGHDYDEKDENDGF